MSPPAFGLAIAVSLLSLSAPAKTAATFFSSYDMFEATLTAPLDELFAEIQKNPEATVAGTLTYADSANGEEVTIDVAEISVRGRTSKAETECTFPKLKLRFADHSTTGTVFDGMKAVKIGTHCGESPDDELTARFGRWANEKAPLREAFVYRLLDVLGVKSFKARPGRIEYVFGKESLVRNAMFLEDDREAMKRFGMSREIEPQQFRSADRDFAVEDTAKLPFAQALIGNFDWCLRFTPDDKYRCDARRPLWNILAFADSGSRSIPLMYDFDVSGMVTSRHRWFSRIFYDRFEGKSAPAIEVLSQVQHTRALFPRAVLDETRRAFLSRKDAAMRAFTDAPLDDLGRRVIGDYIASFFESIADDKFYAPVVVRPNTRIYADANRGSEACGANSDAPVGTLVGKPVDTAGDMVHVPVLDVMWRWVPQVNCSAVHTGPVWIERDAIGTDFPPQ